MISFTFCPTLTQISFRNYKIYIFRCTIDPYLFENFLTEDGNLIRAKFKAFKFPESNFVRFEGVVNVCLDTCPGVSISLLYSFMYMSNSSHSDYT